MDERAKKLVSRFREFYDFYINKIVKAQKEISNTVNLSYVTKRLVEDVIFNQIMVDYLSWTVGMDKKIEDGTMSYETLMNYLIEDCQNTFRRIISCPWQPNSTSAITNIESIIKANATTEWFKLLMDQFEKEGIKTVAFSTVIL